MEPNHNWVPLFYTPMYFTYILLSSTTDRFYAGSTHDLAERLRRHNSDHCLATKGKGPWTLIWFIEHNTRAEAMKLEQKIKKRGIKRFLDDWNQPG